MEIHIGDRIADVTLVSKEGNKVQFLIDGKPYDVDIVMAENGSCSILHDGNSFNAELIRGEGGKSYDVNMFYRSYHVDIVDTQTKYLRMKKGGEEKQEGDKMKRVLLDNNATVKSGDLLEIDITIESKNEYEYICIEDPKAAGFETVDVRSGYNGNSIGAYMEFKNEQVAIFAQRIGHGKYSLSYKVRAEIPGKFSALPTKIYAMYAPELKGNSDENKIIIED